jgi:hypothetical protein
MAEESMRDEGVRYQAMATYVFCSFVGGGMLGG